MLFTSLKGPFLFPRLRNYFVLRSGYVGGIHGRLESRSMTSFTPGFPLFRQFRRSSTTPGTCSSYP